MGMSNAELTSMVKVTYSKDPDNKNNFYDRYVTYDIDMTNVLASLIRKEARKNYSRRTYIDGRYYNS